MGVRGVAEGRALGALRFPSGQDMGVAPWCSDALPPPPEVGEREQRGGIRLSSLKLNLTLCVWATPLLPVSLVSQPPWPPTVPHSSSFTISPVTQGGVAVAVAVAWLHLALGSPLLCEKRPWRGLDCHRR